MFLANEISSSTASSAHTEISSLHSRATSFDGRSNSAASHNTIGRGINADKFFSFVKFTVIPYSLVLICREASAMVADLCFATFPTYQNAVKMSSEMTADHREASQSASRETNKLFSAIVGDHYKKFMRTLSAIISNNYSYPGVYVSQ